MGPLSPAVCAHPMHIDKAGWPRSHRVSDITQWDPGLPCGRTCPLETWVSLNLPTFKPSQANGLFPGPWVEAGVLQLAKLCIVQDIC